MNLDKPVASQYLAALEMLRRAIDKCPDKMWDDPAHKNRYWHIAFHALFYTHLYLQPSEADFEPWEKQKEGYQFMGPVPWLPNEEPVFDEPYSKPELLEYLQLLRLQIADTVATLDFAGESGFSWIPLNKLELQFYSIRHLQQHTGELCERLGHEANIDVNWVGAAPADAGGAST